MHRDEAIYARSDARGGITLTAEEAAVCASALRIVLRTPNPGWTPQREATMRVLSERLEAASTTSSP